MCCEAVSFRPHLVRHRQDRKEYKVSTWHPDPLPQQTDFIDCVRSRQKFALNEENGFRSATIVNMGAVALRLGRNLKFDPDKLLFVDDEAANRLIDQPMRYPWTL